MRHFEYKIDAQRPSRQEESLKTSAAGEDGAGGEDGTSNNWRRCTAAQRGGARGSNCLVASAMPSRVDLMSSCEVQQTASNIALQRYSEDSDISVTSLPTSPS